MTQPFIPPCQESRTRAERCPREGGYEYSNRTKNIGLTACILASSMAFIDGSALTVALPALREDLGGSLVAVQWVLNGYVLSLAALTMIGGSLADNFGRARMLMIGCLAFSLASAACALSPDATWLIGARIAQGAAAAIVTPASLAFIGELFPKDERSKAIGTWAAVSALTTAGGPVLGGWLTESFGWRAVFWINIPVGAVTVLLMAMLPRSKVRIPSRFDMTGAALLALCLLAFALAMSRLTPSEMEGVGSAGADGLLLLFAATLILLLLFLVWERRIDQPMVPQYVFRSRTFSGLNLATLSIYTGLSVMFFLLPFELIDERGFSPTQAGMAFLPFTLGIGLFSRVFGNLSDQFGARPFLILGSLIAAVSFALFAIGEDQSVWIAIIVPMALSGLAFAVLVAPLTAGVMASVDEADKGLASGINNTASRIAQMLGVAMAAMFAASFRGYEFGLWSAAGLCVVGAAIIAVSMSSKMAPITPNTEN